MTRLRLADCFDPTGERFGIPTYPWRHVPDELGLATRRQLRIRGLRPGGQDVAAQILRPRRKRVPLTAYLYRLDLARPVRPMTPGRWRAHEAMMRARRTCPQCRRDAGYVIPPTLGMCVSCADAPRLAA
ncbi:RRQRL motif-containing zinc-binding protein [Streptomyces sp. NPDC005302]|uniref:RRQRL motif-containing zinc-binding protein n=1 Tax=Streptomyces sp. NPDC005302 TaxID=3154675 RepID=UPI0033A5DBD4